MASEKIYHQPELLARIADGDQHAFALFFHQHQAKVLTVSRLYLKVDALAEEALQEIFTKIWINRTRLKQVKDPESYIFIVARNYLIGSIEKWARNKAAESSWMANQLEATADDPVPYSYYRNALSSAIKTLSPQQKTVLHLCKEEQLSYKQIGERLSLSPLTVKKHLQRAMQQIRRFLNDHPLELPLIWCGTIFFL